MNKQTLYIGLNDKDTKIQQIDTLEAVKIVSNVLTGYVDGATIYNATGIYRHDNGDIVIENTLRVELIEADAGRLAEAVKIIKTALNQESIIIQNEIINSVVA